MKRTIVRQWSLGLSVVAVALITVGAIGFTPGITSAHPAVQTGRHIVPGHLVPNVRNAHALGATSGTRILSLSIALAPRNQGMLNALIRAQNDPHSGLYHQYITPQQYVAQFAPTQTSVDQVVSWLRSQGLAVGQGSSNHLLIDAAGSVSTIERAFDVSLADYSYHGRHVHAPTVEPSVPASLAGLIGNTVGPDDVGTYLHAPLIAHGPPVGGGPGRVYTPSELATAPDMHSLVRTSHGAG